MVIGVMDNTLACTPCRAINFPSSNLAPSIMKSEVYNHLGDTIPGEMCKVHDSKSQTGIEKVELGTLLPIWSC
jgi:hypothetical protein